MKEELRKYIDELKEEKNKIELDMEEGISDNQFLIKAVLFNEITKTINKLEKIANQ